MIMPRVCSYDVGHLVIEDRDGIGVLRDCGTFSSALSAAAAVLKLLDPYVVQRELFFHHSA